MTMASLPIVLISTYWNVKMQNGSLSGIAKGFNLNLLECKGRKVGSFKKIARSFNLNLLECKEIREERKKDIQQVLISTYWNVKKGEEEYYEKRNEF